jgi:two-component system, OmpR family, response regulator RegX3
MLPGDSKRILVVDDEDAILQFVSYNLKKEGYVVEVAYDGDEALDAARENEYDLVILDVMLPGKDGFEVCRQIREFRDVPVLFLSARDTELDKVVGLEIGGDDYLAKPFGIRELLARVRALLRRSTGRGGRGEPTEAEPDGHYEAAGITLDEAGHRAWWGTEETGAQLDLTPREFELLACLMRNAGRVLNRDQLLRQAWNWEIVVETKTVDTHIKRLRDKIEQAGGDPTVVETVRGYGYRIGA